MKKYLLIGLFLVAGCCPLAGPAKTFVLTVGDEYLEYVKNDKDMTDDEKRIRRSHVESFARAVAEANK